MSDLRSEIVSLLPRLRRLAWIIVRNQQDCEDLLQRTIERALERSSGWQPGTRLDLWIFRIMKNLWIDETRSRNRWRRLVEPLDADHTSGDHGFAAQAVLDEVDLRRMRDFVEDLPDTQRMAVKLVLLGGHSYAEAAAILEVPEGTLTSRLARGRTALLERFRSVGETQH